jgi:hypothetical protein
MREFAKISPKFWMSPLGKKLKTCEAETRVIAFYLMTCPNSNMIGFYYLPLALMAHEIGIPLEEASKGLKSLIEIGFCAYDELTDCVWIYDMAPTQLGGPLNVKDNKVRHVNDLFQALPETPFLQDFYDKYSNLLHLEPHKKYSLTEEASKRLLSGSEVSKKREVRSKKKEEISNKEDLIVILGGEQSKITHEKNQHNDDEEKSEDPISCVKKIDPIVFTIPLRQGKTRIITNRELDDWQKGYLTVNVRQEIRHLVAWNHANPGRQKTERGINRHIQGWLAHSQQKQTHSSRSSPSQLSTWEHNMAVMKAVLEEDYASS